MKFFFRLAWIFLPVSALTLGLKSPFESVQWLSLIIYVPFALALKRAGAWTGLLVGLLYGGLAWASGLWWLLTSMDTLMGMDAWQRIPMATTLWLYQSLPFAVLGLVCGWMNRRGRSAGPLFCASLLTLLVYFRPVFCPVSSVVSVALWTPFIQIADLGGEYLVFFLLLLINWLFADLVANWGREWKKVGYQSACAVVLIGGMLAYGYWRIPQYDEHGVLSASRTMSIASLQPNVPVRWGNEGAPIEKFSSDEELCLRTLNANEDIVHGANLLVFPELPTFNCLESEFKISGLQATLGRLGISTIIPSDEFIYATETSSPIVLGEMRSLTIRSICTKYNSLFFLPYGENCTLAYRKLKLVPFSEATPLRDTFPWLKKVIGRKLEVSKGEGVKLIHSHGLNIQPLICFESGFANLVRIGVDQGADLFVEVSNDGWFGSRDAEMKHLGMGIFRAVETRRPLVRCSNSGAGAHVWASGEIVPGTLTPHGRASLTRAKLYCPEVTTLYAKLGDGWLWGAGLIVVWGLGSSFFRVRKKD